MSVCHIADTLGNLAEPYSSALENLLSGDMSADIVASAMRKAGLRSSASAITRHRRGVCCCVGAVNVSA